MTVSPLPSLAQPLYPGYAWRYKDDYARLLKHLVPPSGPAPTVQGELMRAVDKLWFEGQDNGNVNWGPDFEFFLDVLAYYLLTAEPPFLNAQDRAMLEQDLAVLRHCGHVAYRLKPQWARHGDYLAFLGQRPDIQNEPDGPDATPDLAYAHDDLYQHLMDCVVTFILAFPQTIPYTSPAGFSH